MSEYETDILLWSEHQADALRRKALNEIDWDNVAEEIEAVGTSQKHEVRRRLALLCQHLLKWTYQSEHQSRSWRATIRIQRDDLMQVLDDSPSLRPFAAQVFDVCYARGRTHALEETGLLHLPDTCPWTIDQVLNNEFWP